METFEGLNEIWENELLNPSFDAFRVFGHPNTNPITSDEHELEQTRKFLNELKYLCSNRYQFNIKNPKKMSKLPFVNPGKLSPWLANELNELYTKANDRIDYLKEQMCFFKEMNKSNESQGKKPGPKPMPSHFAMMLLVGIQLYSQNKVHLEKFKEYLRRGVDGEDRKEGLEYKLKIGEANKRTLNSLFLSFSEASEAGEDLLSWKKETKQMLERKLVSNLVGKYVNSFKPYPEEIKKIRADVIAHSDSIREKACLR